MFFGTLLSLGSPRIATCIPIGFETASEQLAWYIGGINTLVLLVSSFTIVLAVHFSKLGDNRRDAWCLAATAALGCLFLVFKAGEYYIDYRESLIPALEIRPAGMDRQRPSAAGTSAACAAIPGLLLGDDADSCPARDDRHRRGAGDHGAGVPQAFFDRCTTLRSKCWRCIGILSISFGFFCSRCCICKARTHTSAFRRGTLWPTNRCSASACMHSCLWH